MHHLPGQQNPSPWGTSGSAQSTPGVILPPPPRRLQMKPGRETPFLDVFLILVIGPFALCSVGLGLYGVAVTLGAAWAWAGSHTVLASLLGMQIVSAWAMALGTGGLSWLFWSRTFGVRGLRKRLLERGEAVVGVVTRKEITQSRNTEGASGPMFSVYYRFATSEGTREACALVLPDEYNAAQPGHPLTIFFDPRKPGNSTPLEYADHFILLG